MKNLIIENGWEQDIPKELQVVLKNRFLENREIWERFQFAFWPENREATMRRFCQLESGDNIICHTVFDGWAQLELMAKLLNELNKKKIRVNFYIMLNDLKGQIQEYLNYHESDIVPHSPYYDNSWTRRKRFKMKMNQAVLQAVANHNIINLNRYAEDEDIPLKVSDFRIKKEVDE